MSTLRTAGRCGLIRRHVALSLLLGCGVMATAVHAGEHMSGDQLIHHLFARQQQYPFIYKEESMIMTDAEGHRDVRQVRHYFRLEDDGTAKSLLIFDAPEDVRGTALLAIYQRGKAAYTGLYIPALRQMTLLNGEHSRSSHFLGTDFTAEELLPEREQDYHYQRQKNRRIGELEYWVVDAIPRNLRIEQETGNSKRRLFIHPEHRYIERIDYFDRHGRLYKRLTRHDFHQLNGTMWRSNMIRMENFREQHETLIKVEKRIFSSDYVPESMFHVQWVTTHLNLGEAEQAHSEEDQGSDTSKQTKGVNRAAN